MLSRFLAVLMCLSMMTSSISRGETAPAQEPLKLTDGRIFTEWRITGESAAYVTVRHKGGLAQVSKKMLPESLRASYPIDKEQLAAERAADAESKRNREARLALEAQARRESAAHAAQSARSTAATATVTTVQPTTGMDRALYNRLVGAAKDRANQYFRFEFEPSGTSRIYSLDVSVNTDDPEPWAGIPGRYTVKGKGFFVYYGSRGYSGFDRATKEFTAFIDVTQYGTKVVDFRTW